MSFSLIPAIGLIVLLLVAAPSNSESMKSKKKESKAKPATLQVKKNHAKEKKKIADSREERKKKTVPSKKKKKDTQGKYLKLESGNIEKKKDYQTILSYIKGKYRKIKDDDARQISKYLVEFGEQHQLDPKFAAAVVARESAFNRHAVSSTGAKGLGQIKDFNFKDLNIQNPFNIKENASGTTKYLKEMLSNWKKKATFPTVQEKAAKDGAAVVSNRKKDESRADELSYEEKIKLALASYYKGFTAVKRGGRELDEKTSQYVEDIMANYDELLEMKRTGGK